MYTTKAVKRTAVALIMASIGTSAMAAGTDTGVQAGFYALGQDLATIVAGAGGYVIMLLSVIIGGVTLAVTGRWGQVAIAVGVALFLGYGIQTLTSLGGVSAGLDLLELTAIEPSVVPTALP